MRSWGTRRSLGKNTIVAANLRRLSSTGSSTIHEESHGNADLVAHFFRRAFDLLRAGGAFGLIATNTIAQGDTRATGLRWICTHGGTIFAARKRVQVAGAGGRGRERRARRQRGDRRDRSGSTARGRRSITAFLFHAADTTTRRGSRRTRARAFMGSIVLGMGFTFDDTDTKGVATPIAEMHRLIAKDPRNRGADLPLHRRRGGQRQSDARASPVRHQLRRA